MPTRSITALAVALAVLSACDATMPWAPLASQEREDPGPAAGTLSVTPSRLTASALPGTRGPAQVIHATVTGAAGPVFWDYWYEGSPAVEIALRTTASGAEVDVWVSEWDWPGTYHDQVTIRACADPGCTRQLAGSPAVVPVTVVLAPADLVADRGVVTLDWMRGAPPPAPVDVQITERVAGASGPATLSLEYLSAATGWLGASWPGGASVPGTVRLAVNPGAIATGAHSARVRVVALGAAEEVRVELAVREPPVSVAPAALGFLAVSGQALTPDGATLSVASTSAAIDGYTTEVTYGVGATGWLSVAAAGTIPGTLAVAPSRTDLPPGSHTAQIRLVSLGGDLLAVVDVGYEVVAAGVTPTPAAVELAAFQGAATPPGVPVALATPLGAGVDWVAAVEYAGAQGWLDVPASGTAPGTFSARASRTDLAPGVHQATVRLASPGGEPFASIPVTYVVTAPVLSVDGAPIAFGGARGAEAPAARTVALTTSADVPMPYVVAVEYGATASGWLDAPAAGTAPGLLALRPSRSDLPPGRHEATVRVRGPGGEEHGTVAVTFDVSDAVVPTPAALAFGGVHGQSAPPPSATVALTTVSGLEVAYVAAVEYAAGASGWLEVVPPGTAPGTLTVRPSRADVGAGSYAATVRLATAGGTALGEVSVTYELAAPPLSAPPASGLVFIVTLNTAPAELHEPLQLVNAGAPVAFTVTAPDWLAVAPASGEAVGTETWLDVEVVPSAVPAPPEPWRDSYLRGTIDVSYAPPGATAPVVLRVPVVLGHLLPSVRVVAPWTIRAGDATPVVVRGLEFPWISPTVRFGPDASPEVTYVDGSELLAVPPALAPGRHAVRVVNALGFATREGALEVVAVSPRPAASGPSRAGERTRILRDDVRGAVYAANATAGELERWRDANGLAREALALPGLRDVAFSPDGSRLVALAGDALWEIDPVAFEAPAAPLLEPLHWAVAGRSWSELAVANDGFALVVPAGTAAGRCVKVSLAARYGALVFDCDVAGTGEELAASRDGGRIAIAAEGTSLAAYVANWESVGLTQPAGGSVSRPALDRTGRRALAPGVGTPIVRDEYLRPIPGQLGPGTLAAALSDDGTRAFTYDDAGRVHVWDVSVPMGAPLDRYPEVGDAGGFLPSVAPGGAGVRMALSVDEQTLYLVGETALVVVPLPDP